MKESLSMEIHFPDVDIDTWNAMLAYLEKPTMARTMTVQEAIALAMVYDKYDFTNGRDLCNKVISEFFVDTERKEANESPDIDLVIEAVVVASNAHLSAARDQGMKFIFEKLRMKMFSTIQKNKLVWMHSCLRLRRFNAPTPSSSSPASPSKC